MRAYSPTYDSAQGIVDEFYPEAVFKQNQLIANINAKLTPNFSVMGFYNFTTAHADTGTASNSENLSQDYGRASFAPRNMVFLMANYQAPWGIRLNPMLIAQAGKPFNIVTNNDLTGDNFFNNRPELVDSSYCTTSTSATTPAPYAQTSFGCLSTEPTGSYTPIPINLGTGPAAVAVNLRISRAFGLGPKVSSTNNQDNGGGPAAGHLQEAEADAAALAEADPAVVLAREVLAVVVDGLRAACSDPPVPDANTR